MAGCSSQGRNKSRTASTKGGRLGRENSIEKSQGSTLEHATSRSRTHHRMRKQQHTLAILQKPVPSLRHRLCASFFPLDKCSTGLSERKGQTTDPVVSPAPAHISALCCSTCKQAQHPRTRLTASTTHPAPHTQDAIRPKRSCPPRILPPARPGRPTRHAPRQP